MAKFYVEKEATIWFGIEIEAENLEDALEKAEDEYRENGLSYFSETEGVDLTGAYWVGDEDRNEVDSCRSFITLEVRND